MDQTELQFKAQLISASVVLVVGCFLIVFGFMTPPLGIIDSSVLVAFGEALSFVGAILGIDYHYKYKYRKL